MKMNWSKVALVLVLFLVLVNFADAQCAMCKMQAENAAEETKGFAEGLNTGILYLMGIPYGLMVVGGAVFLRSLIKKDREQHSDEAVKNHQNR